MQNQALINGGQIVSLTGQRAAAGPVGPAGSVSGTRRSIGSVVDIPREIGTVRDMAG